MWIVSHNCIYARYFVPIVRMRKRNFEESKRGTLSGWAYALIMSSDGKRILNEALCSTWRTQIVGCASIGILKPRVCLIGAERFSAFPRLIIILYNARLARSGPRNVFLFNEAKRDLSALFLSNPIINMRHSRETSRSYLLSASKISLSQYESKNTLK